MIELSGIQGSWWIAEYSEAKVTGSVTFRTQDGGKFEAWGPRLGVPLGTDSFAASNRAPLYFERIFGETEIGPITLMQCRVVRSSYNLGVIETKHFIDFRGIIRGVHADMGHGFGGLRAEIVNLDDWASFAKIKPDGAGGYAVERYAGSVVMLHGSDNLELRALISGGQDPRSARIKIGNQLRITLSSSVKYEEMMTAWLGPFVDLLTLMAVRLSPIRKLEISDGTSEADWYEVGIRQDLDPDTASSISFVNQPIFWFADLDPARHVVRWYELADTLQGVFGYTFGARFSQDTFAENRYLNATTAAEAMHRELVRENRKRVDLEDPAVQSFVESFPEDEQDLLTQRIRHLNDTSFHDRLNEIYEKTRPFSQMVAPNRNKWITAVKKARNSLTHQSGKLVGKIPPVDKLNILGESVFYLTTVYILVELGLPAQDVSDRLYRLPRTKYLIRFLQDSFPEFKLSSDSE